MEGGRGEKRQRKEGPMPAIPDPFICPMSGKMMGDPVSLPDVGLVVEKALADACSDNDHVHRSISSKAKNVYQLMGYSRDTELKGQIDAWCFDNRREPPEPISPRTADRLVLVDKWGSNDGSFIPSDQLCPVCRNPMVKPAKASRCARVADTMCLWACKDLGYMPTFLADHFSQASDISWTADPATGEKIRVWCSENHRQQPMPSVINHGRLYVGVMKDGPSAEEEAMVGGWSLHLRQAGVSLHEHLFHGLRSDQTRDSALEALIDYPMKLWGSAIVMCSAKVFDALKGMLNDVTVQGKAVHAILVLSERVENARKLLNFGALEALLNVVTSANTGRLVGHAEAAICNLAKDNRIREAMGSRGAIHPLVQKLFGPAGWGRIEAARALAYLTRQCQPNLTLLSSLCPVPRLMSAAARYNLSNLNINSADHEDLMGVVLLMVNFAASAESARALLETGAVELMLKMKLF